MTAGELRAGTHHRTLLAAAAVGLGVCAFGVYGSWRVRSGPPLGWLEVIVVWLAIGLAAGLISGRSRDTLISWAIAVAVSVAAYEITNAIDPTWPRSEDPFELIVVMNAIFLLATIGGGHLIGVRFRDRWAAASQARFDRREATINR
jgi:hypothetical protein